MANLPAGEELIEAICVCRPQWVRIALESLLHCQEIESDKIIKGILVLFPHLCHFVISTCLKVGSLFLFDYLTFSSKESIHANLLLQVISSQPAEKFLSLFNSIYRRNSIKWLASQFQRIVATRSSVKTS